MLRWSDVRKTHPTQKGIYVKNGVPKSILLAGQYPDILSEHRRLTYFGEGKKTSSRNNSS